MSDVIKFTESCKSFNDRLNAKQHELAALVEERTILLDQARGNGVMVSAAKAMLGKLAFTITMPEGFKPAEHLAASEIVRHPERAAE